MKLTLIGAGYVGLVSAVGFAEKGNEICCVEIDKSKVEMINSGKSPIYEKDLDSYLSRHVDLKKIKATSSIKEGLLFSDIIFIAVGTPPKEDGSPDMSYINKVLDDMIPHMNQDKIIVNKSTVPVGSAHLIQETVNRKLKENHKDCQIFVISNPEFLREGEALHDFLYPDRIIIGGEDKKSLQVLKNLYMPFVEDEHKIIMMDAVSSEMTKYASNAMLASRIAFINEISRICSKVGANVENVRIGMGTDKRIGPLFLKAGIGYGGSCFPKDVDALIHLAKENQTNPLLLEAIKGSNHYQVEFFVKQIESIIEKQSLKNMAVWGISFKAGTDDIRESQALKIVEKLRILGYELEVYDPQALDHSKKILSALSIQTNRDKYDVLKDKDGLIILTDWPEFLNPDFNMIKKLLKKHVIFDGRNIFDPQILLKNEIQYYSIGRQAFV